MKKKVTVEILNPVYSKVKEGLSLVKESLSYDSSFYRQTRFGKKRIESRKYLIDRKSGLFYTGLLNKLEDFCRKNQIEFSLELNPLFLELEREIQPKKNFSLKGISCRDDQIDLIENALKKRRGLIIAPTGFGKSILAAMIIKSFQGKKILLLCYRTGIIKQFETDLKNLGLKNVAVYDSAKKDISAEVLLSTAQAFRNLPLLDIADEFDVVIVDECHLAMSRGGTYEQILNKLLAPIRIGLTATAPTIEEKSLISIGLLGELIDRITYEEGNKLDILARPHVELVNVPKSSKISTLKRYKDIYDEGIVKNKLRNRLVIDKAASLVERDKSVLIFVTQLEHGQLLYNLAMSEDLNVVYIHGTTSPETREQIRNKVEKKEIDVVISSVIWREGINIKSLGSVILASGGKSEIALIQACGRALRKDDGKEEAILVDFLDPYPYLSSHAIERLQIFNELGWI